MPLANVIPDWFKTTAAGAALLAADTKKAHVERQKIIDRVAELRRELAPAKEAHDHNLEELRAAQFAARAKFEAATSKLVAADRAGHAAVHQITREIETAESKLVASCDPKISDARRTLDAKWEAERHGAARGEDRVVSTKERDGMTFKLKTERWDNQRAIVRLLLELRTARARLDRLKVENPENVAEAIATIERPVALAYEMLAKLEPDDGPAAA